MNDLALAAPARPEGLTVDFYREQDCLFVKKRARSDAVVPLLIFLVIWTAACLKFSTDFVRDSTLEHALFSIPFWAAWLAVLGILIWMACGMEILFLYPEVAKFQSKALIQLSARTVPAREILDFREYRYEEDEGERESRNEVWEIEMVTIGRPLRFLSGLSVEERAWLIYQLNRFLIDVRLAAGTPVLESIFPMEDLPEVGESTQQRAPANQVITIDLTLDEPPSDANWQFKDEFNQFAFVQRGSLMSRALLPAILLNVFFNGFLAYFVATFFEVIPNNHPPQVEWQWWLGLLVIGILSIIGVVILALPILILIAPLCSERWCFLEDRIVWHRRYVVFSRTREWAVLGLDRLELRQSVEESDLCAGVPFALTFVTKAQDDLCTMAGLTEGEVRWMTGIIQKQRSTWFGAGHRRDAV